MLNQTKRVVRHSRQLAVYIFCFILVLPMWFAPPKANAADFEMQTGYYMGNGSAGHAITGIGFQPDFVMIKSSTTAGAAVFKTSAMPGNTTAFTSATANDTGTNITLDADGFTLGTLVNVNSANVLYYWVAFTGSDCSATGNYCVGTYTGNGVSPRNITTVGFQPSFVMNKRSTAVAGHFRTASEPANETLFFTNTARDVAGNYIRAMLANGFTVGATDNANGGTYYFVAFATTAGAMHEGTYTGNNTDNRSITGVGFKPDFTFVKNATSATANNRHPQMNINESYGDNSSYIGINTANIFNSIQALESDGFQIGTDVRVNENAATFYHVSFGGAPSWTASGSFSMQNGSYTGNGAARSITGLGFRPDLVIIKGAGATQGVFRTYLMKGDSTAYLASATANLTGAITSLDADGFSLGTNAVVNTNGTVYQWQAFTDAFDPYDNSGSADFAIGAYYGISNTYDNRNITRLPFQPDMVALKRNGTSAGIWRSTANAGDSTSFFANTADAANNIQALNSDGFQVGANNNTNAAASIYYWFAFKEGSNFDVGSYTGNGVTRNITGVGFRPELTWVKRSTGVNGVHRGVSLTGNNTQYFNNVANVADRITGFVKDGFSLGATATEVNANGGTYRYASWNNPSYGSLSVDIVNASGTSVASPSFAMNSFGLQFECSSASGTLGLDAQRLRVQNGTTTPTWTVSIAATSGATDLWRNVGDTQQYDFNDPSGSPAGCADGGDADTEAGQLTLNPSTATIAPESGCSSANVSLGSSTAFNEGTTNSIVLTSASASADADCYWDITGINMSQYIPKEQTIDSYSINFTITIIAS